MRPVTAITTGMAMCTSITTESRPALMRLLHLVSPSLPIGSFTYSQGIEWGVECGWIDSAGTLGEWLEDQLMTAIACLDLPVLLRLYHAAAEGDVTALEDWSQFLLASRETAELRQEEINRGRALADLLVATGLTPSKGAARRAASDGGVYVNNERVEDADAEVNEAHLLHGRWLVLRRGRRTVAGVDTSAAQA